MHENINVAYQKGSEPGGQTIYKVRLTQEEEEEEDEERGGGGRGKEEGGRREDKLGPAIIPSDERIFIFSYSLAPAV